MRFEVISAYAMGIALPLLEVIRRRTNFDEFVFYIDDFLLGALLLWGAHAIRREKAYGPGLLIAAWWALCGGFYGSFFGQLLSTSDKDVSGFSNTLVVVVKGLLFAIALTSAVLSIRSAAATKRN